VLTATSLGSNDDGNNNHHDAGITSTRPLAASHCSQVGSRVLKATTGTCKRQRSQDEEDGDDENPSTHLHRCELLLAGWIGGC
jgi:hypothetical protein